MALPLNLGVDQLGKDLTSAVTGTGGSEALANGLNKSFFNWVATVYPTFLGIVIFVVVAFVFYGSFLYITAYGDENRATMAKKTLTYAFIGLIIASLSWAIASYARRSVLNLNNNTTVDMETYIKESVTG